MSQANRRSFLKHLAAGGSAALLAARSPLWAAAPKRQFTLDLVCGAIGVGANQVEAIGLAARHGFESVQPAGNELSRMSEPQWQEICKLLKQHNLVWGAAGLPVDFRRDEAKFQADLKGLAPIAARLQQVGASRVSTWLSPAHATLTYRQNFAQHVARLRQVARVLNDHGQRFGLEYVGPKTSWSAARYPFIHTLAEARELIAEIAVQNVGLVLDSWHWYTAGETVADLLSLRNRDIVACDLNDAPAGVPVDAQIDSRRELPAATGVIDLAGFLTALAAIGYDGPVRAEPFNQQLRDLDDEAAVAATAAALQKACALIRSSRP